MGVCRYPHTERVVLKTHVPQTARPDRVEKKMANPNTLKWPRARLTPNDNPSSLAPTCWGPSTGSTITQPWARTRS